MIWARGAITARVRSAEAIDKHASRESGSHSPRNARVPRRSPMPATRACGRALSVNTDRARWPSAIRSRRARLRSGLLNWPNGPYRCRKPAPHAPQRLPVNVPRPINRLKAPLAQRRRSIVTTATSAASAQPAPRANRRPRRGDAPIRCSHIRVAALDLIWALRVRKTGSRAITARAKSPEAPSRFVWAAFGARSRLDACPARQALPKRGRRAHQAFVNTGRATCTTATQLPSAGLRR